MHSNGWKGRLIEASAFIAVAAIAFVGGLLIGDLSASPKTETVLATSLERRRRSRSAGSD